MKKLLQTLVLLVVILGTFSFVALRISAAGSDSDYFNSHLRAKFDHSSLLRDILYLHNNGDGQSDYLGKDYAKILIEVDSMQGLAPDYSMLNKFSERVQALTGKPTSDLLSSMNIPYSAEVNESQISGIVSQNQDLSNGNGTAIIYLVFLSTQQSDSKTLGETYKESGIVVFAGALKEFSSPSPDTFYNYEYSTILHEFGHQLGLQHDNDPGCIMNSHAEIYTNIPTSPQDVVTDFCPKELDLIKMAKNLSN